MIWANLQNKSELFLRNFWYLNQIHKPDSPYSYKPTDTCQPKKKIKSKKKKKEKEKKDK